MKKFIYLLLSISVITFTNLNAGLKKFTNNSDLVFNDYFENGLPYKEMLEEGQTVSLTMDDSTISTLDGTFKIHLKERFSAFSDTIINDGKIFLETDFPYLGKTKLYFVYYYTFSIWTEIGIVINEDRTVTFEPLHHIQRLIYPATMVPQGTVDWSHSY